MFNRIMKRLFKYLVWLEQERIKSMIHTGSGNY